MIIISEKVSQLLVYSNVTLEQWSGYFDTIEPITIILGSEFKTKYPDKKFYKITNKIESYKNDSYKDNTYKTGYNGHDIDINSHSYKIPRIMRGMSTADGNGFTWPSHPDDTFASSALYFIEKDKLSWEFAYYPNCYIREVEIPDNSVVCERASYFQTNAFILGDETLLEDSPLWDDIEFCKTVLKESPSMLSKMNKKFQTKELCEIVVHENAKTIKFVRKDLQTTELWEMAAHKWGEVIQYINKELQTSKLCNIAIQNNGNALKHVNKNLQTEELCMIAVLNTGNAIRYVNKKLLTEGICITAVQCDGTLLKYIDEQFQTENVCMLAIKRSSYAKGYIKSYSLYLKICAKQLFGI